MSLRRFTSLAAAQGARLIDFEECEVVAGFAGGHILIVRGEAPCANIEVRLSPLVYLDCPDYWRIELIGLLAGSICLPAVKPFSLALPLDGIVGHAGIEVAGSTTSRRFDLPGGCSRGRSFEGAATEGESEGCGAGAFRHWRAIADFQPIVEPKPLRVRGEYRLDLGSGRVRLEERYPPGLNPAELILDLVVESRGPGGEWVAAEERFAAREGQYQTVRIFDPQGEQVAIPVQEVH